MGSRRWLGRLHVQKPASVYTNILAIKTYQVLQEGALGGSSPASEVGWETKHRPQNAKCRPFPLGKGGRWVCLGVCHCDPSAALGLLMASEGLVVGALPQHHCKHHRWRVGQSLHRPPKHPLCRSLAAEERSPLAFWKAGHSTAASQRGAEAGSGQEMCESGATGGPSARGPGRQEELWRAALTDKQV